MPYISINQKEKETLLQKMGKKSVNDFFACIPEKIRCKGLKERREMGEPEIRRKIETLSGKNKNLICFAGYGAYEHYIPAIVPYLTSRSEFLTAYTPYQPEVSQGTLQAIYEFQSYITEISGLDVANASMYDGATAAAEAASMVCGQSRRKKILVDETLNGKYREVLKTYLEFMDLEYIPVPEKNRVCDLDSLKSLMTKECAGFITQYPNQYGILADYSEYTEVVHQLKGFAICVADPVACSTLASPAQMNFDIACGEGQPLGIPMSYGGPYLGYLACSKALMRKIPGRIAGKTVDRNGKTGYVLTLQAREQHIRRDKATSNICSNQANCALSATIYLSLMGSKGMEKTVMQCLNKTRYLAEKLNEIDGISVDLSPVYFREFPVNCEKISSETILQKLAEKGILGGVSLQKQGYSSEDILLVAVTEMRTQEEMDSYVEIVRGLI